MIVTSKDNENIKHIKKLKEKKYRDESNQYVVEGIKMIREAIKENAKVNKIIICDECIQDGTIEQKLLYEIAKFECIYVSEQIFKVISDVKNPQGILAIIDKDTKNKKIDFSENLILVLDGIQDPGNLGTILRTADSANLKQIIVSKECGDIYNPKVIRSSMGSIFRINVIEVDDLVKTLKDVNKQGFRIIGTDLNTNKTIYDIDYNKSAIIIGNEANGVSKDVLDISNEKIKIPMLGKTESLNASVATGIILYEYVRKNLIH